MSDQETPGAGVGPTPEGVPTDVQEDAKPSNALWVALDDAVCSKEELVTKLVDARAEIRRLTASVSLPAPDAPDVVTAALALLKAPDGPAASTIIRRAFLDAANGVDAQGRLIIRLSRVDVGFRDAVNALLTPVNPLRRVSQETKPQ